MWSKHSYYKDVIDCFPAEAYCIDDLIVESEQVGDMYSDEGR